MNIHIWSKILSPSLDAMLTQDNITTEKMFRYNKQFHHTVYRQFSIEHSCLENDNNLLLLNIYINILKYVCMTI